MITKISMENVASYKALTALETSKPVNLVYGLNGSGKTTISKYLRNSEDEIFKHCSYEYDDYKDFTFKVYNQSFIDDVFFNQDTQKGIFTLSKKNNDDLTSIEDAMSFEAKLAIIQREFDRLYDPNHPVRNHLETLDSVPVVKTIREALKR